jgi:hypothetical protein
MAGYLLSMWQGLMRRWQPCCYWQHRQRVAGPAAGELMQLNAAIVTGHIATAGDLTLCSMASLLQR